MLRRIINIVELRREEYKPVAVAAVVLSRVRKPRFLNTLPVLLAATWLLALSTYMPVLLAPAVVLSTPATSTAVTELSEAVVNSNMWLYRMP